MSEKKKKLTISLSLNRISTRHPYCLYSQGIVIKVTAFSAKRFLQQENIELTLHKDSGVTHLISMSISLHMGQDWTLRRQGLHVT